MGCATYLPSSYEDHCALKGLKLEGVDDNFGRSFHTNPQTGQYVIGNQSGENIRCVVPKTDVEKCEVENKRKVAEPIDEYNDGVKMRRIFTAYGYAFFFVPGYITNLFSEKKRDKAIEESNSIKATLNKCEPPKVVDQ